MKPVGDPSESICQRRRVEVSMEKGEAAGCVTWQDSDLSEKRNCSKRIPKIRR